MRPLVIRVPDAENPAVGQDIVGGAGLLFRRAQAGDERERVDVPLVDAPGGQAAAPDVFEHLEQRPPVPGRVEVRAAPRARQGVGQQPGVAQPAELGGREIRPRARTVVGIVAERAKGRATVGHGRGPGQHVGGGGREGRGIGESLIHWTTVDGGRQTYARERFAGRNRPWPTPGPLATIFRAR